MVSRRVFFRYRIFPVPEKILVVEVVLVDPMLSVLIAVASFPIKRVWVPVPPMVICPVVLPPPILVVFPAAPSFRDTAPPLTVSPPLPVNTPLEVMVPPAVVVIVLVGVSAVVKASRPVSPVSVALAVTVIKLALIGAYFSASPVPPSDTEAKDAGPAPGTEHWASV